jgi:DNA topoisomerase-1
MPSLRKNLAKQIDDNEEATVLALILATGMRMGGDKVRGDVPAYGASNLRKKHVTMKGNKAHLDFVGKHGVHIEQDVELEPKLARAIRNRIESAPDDESPIFASSPQKIRDKLAEVTGGKFKVHDLRTYTATALALEEVTKQELPKDAKDAMKKKKQVATVVSSKLGNTPQMAMNSYISPQVWSNWDAWIEGIGNDGPSH